MTNDLPETLLPLDLRAALERVGGNRIVLRKLLIIFHDEFREATPQLRVFIRDGLLKEAERLAHSLKSAAATVEANALSHAAALLEGALRETRIDRLSQMVDDLDAQLLPALTAISSLR